jgi:3-demethylubiquinone-9 3-methyltransferase
VPSKHDPVASLADSAIGPAGSVVIVDFTLFGQTFMAMSAGPNDPFNEAISFRVNCSSQSEIDTYTHKFRFTRKSRQRVQIRRDNKKQKAMDHNEAVLGHLQNIDAGHDKSIRYSELGGDLVLV